MSFKESSSACTLLCYIQFCCGYIIPSGLIWSIYPNYSWFISLVLRSGFQGSRNFEIHRVRQYLGNFTGLAGRVNANVYKTESIFTCLGHGKLSQFLALYVHTLLNVSCHCVPFQVHLATGIVRNGVHYGHNTNYTDNFVPGQAKISEPRGCLWEGTRLSCHHNLQYQYIQVQRISWYQMKCPAQFLFDKKIQTYPKAGLL